MTRTVFAVALALVGLLGLAVRLAPIHERHLGPEIRDLGTSRWVIDEPGTALHLRRIELALAEGRVPQHDPFLAHPGTAEIPALPVFDALIAGFAERWLAWPDGDPSLAGVDEADLEAFAAWVGPVAYLFGFAALAWAAWISARGARAPTVLAAALLALAPATVAATEIGRLDAAAFVLVLLALLVRGTQVAVRAEDALSTILEALLCGVVAGLLTSMTAAGPLLALPTGAALFLRAIRGPAEVRPIAVRAGLLFSLAAAFLARLPLADGPWERLPEGLVARWTFAASDVLLVAAAPFALLLLTAPRDAARKGWSFARIAALAAMLALLVFELPRAWGAASGPIAAWWEARGILGPPAGAERWPQLGAVAVLGLGFGGWRLSRNRDAASLHLLLLTLATGLLAIADPAFAPLLVLSGACALAGAMPSLASRYVSRGGFAAALLLLVWPVVRALDRPSDAERENHLAYFTALRWIRKEVPPGGPFNSSSAQSTWGILADPRDGELVAYHARRPVLGSRASAFSRPAETREGLRLMQLGSIDELAARMQVLRLKLAVTRGADRDPARTPFKALLGPATEGREPAVLRRIFTSDASIRSGRDGLVPAAVIWSLEAPPAPRTPTLQAPR
ncbi:MAG: hypothetical protein NTY35_05585 [Planctomycetota bacterium]|nr:hypothetical protein [Planctomycetota bacterium]